MMPLLIVLALVKLLHLAFAAMDFAERLSREAERTLFFEDRLLICCAHVVALCLA
jgi:hypothetical protein